MDQNSGRVIDIIIEGLREFFPQTQDVEYTPQSHLGELPEWDSMAAVNLQTYLLNRFDIEVPLELLTDETALEEIVTFLKNPISSEVV